MLLQNYVKYVMKSNTEHLKISKYVCIDLDYNFTTS